ncbi:beta strand repeat-containing protein [Mycolicibacterium frederiksbergense]|uniref:beta strand repeat-containing protein n=2 Tax=Mycolicibacterium frederiksbergense TaxID=117567 RepID=UPI00143C53E9|nr:Ig-like domain-containing protein [Mycolicibacterium frederiksbergense]
MSLGVGVAVATTPGVAHATTESDTDAQSGTSSESPSNTGTSPGADTDTDAAPEDDEDDKEDEDDEPTDFETIGSSTEDDGDDEELEEPDDADDEVIVETESPPEIEPIVPDSAETDHGSVVPAGSAEAEEHDVRSDSRPDPASTLDSSAPPTTADDEGDSLPVNPFGLEIPDPATDRAPGIQASTFTTPIALSTTSLNPVDALLAVPRTLGGMLSGAISTILAPFLLTGPSAPVQTPLLWTVLAWVRRQIVHTFFNRTPQVSVEQVLPPDVPGLAIFDLNATDPNCDPVTTTITEQPEFGTVVKNLDGTFTYTADVDHLLTGVTDSFTVVVTDSVGTHLSGPFGRIQNFFHRIAQFFGLAKPDTIAVTVPVAIPGIGVDLPPVLVVSPAAAVVAGDSVVLSPVVLLTDPDSQLLSGATVTIAGQGSDPSDDLTFTPSGGITGTYANGVLTLTGSASVAAYQTVLQTVSFSTNAGALVGLRTVTWSVVDDDGTASLPGLTEVVVVGVLNAPPTVVVTPVGVVTAGQSTTVSPVVVIVNEPGELLGGATVTIALGGDPSDELTFTPSGGITGTYANGVLTLTGSATAVAYQTVLQSVSFSTDAAGLVGVRTIEFSVVDAAGQESLLPGVTALTVVGALNAPPTVVTTPVGVVTAGQSTTVSPIVVIVNEPGELLDGATVTITLGADPSDELTFTGSGGINGTYVDGVLTLTGSATAAAYQTVLQSVSFVTDAAGLVGVRTIEFSVVDAAGQESLLPGITALTVVGVLNGAPTIVTSPVGVVTAGQSTTVSPVVVIVNEPGELLDGATVTITLGGDPGDELTFTPSGGINGTYVDGVLTLTGSATTAAYQTVLQSVSFVTDAAGLVGVRTIEFAVTDAVGQESLLPGITALTVVGVLNGAPTIVTSPVGVVTAGQSTTVSPVVVIVNEPGELLGGATVAITLGGDPSDELTFTESGGITGTYANGVLTLTGGATAAAYQTVLQSVSFTTDAAGLVGVRTIEFSVVDAAGQESLLPGITALTVVGVLNGAPTIVTSPVGVVTAGQSTTVSPIVVIVNEPGELLGGATVTIALGGDPLDELTFTGSGGITGTYADGVLTLTGSATTAAYQTVLQSVSFSTDAAGLVGVRTIEFAVTDAVGQESLLPGVTALTVVGVLNGAPTIVVTPVGAVTAGQSTTVSPVVVIVNETGENLTGATVTITLGGDPSDELTFTPSDGITGTYANGVLTLTGSATAAAYQTVLQSVSFTTDAAGLVGVRTIEFAVTDAVGQESLLPGITALTVVGVLNGAPTIVTSPVGVVTAGQSTTVSPVVVIVNEPGELLDGATVTITLGGDPSDELTFTASNGVTGSYADGVLTLTGSATTSAYQTVLQSVSFTTDAAGLVGVRTIEFAVTDAVGQESLLPGVTALTVVGVLNGAPTIVTSPVGVVTAGQSTTVSPVVVIVNETGENLTGATVTITLGADPTDELTFTPSNGISGSYSNGVLTLTGSATASAYQTVLQSVSFSTDAAGLVGVRTIEFSVTDAVGQESLLPGITALTVVGVLNGAPTIVTTPVGVVTAGQSTTVSPVVVIVNEPGELLDGATVTITLGGDPSDELTFTPSGGITGTYANGVLTLTGSASAAAYQTVLQSVSFSTDAAGLVGVRTIEFSVVDAAGQESLLPGVTALTVVGVLNGAPTIVTSPVGVVTAGQSTTVSPIVVIVNEPGELLGGATVTIALGGDPLDELTFTGSGGITGTYADGVLTLTGSATTAAYQTVLQSVSFTTDAAGLVGVRTIEFAVTDAVGQESLLPGVTALTVVGVLNGAPTIVVTPVGVVTAGQSTTVSPMVVIVNEPGELLDGATVTITLGGDPSDELTFTPSDGITGTYANGVLTLTGSATAAAYQTVLQSVSLSTDAAGLVGVRTIEFAVTDAVGQESLLPGITALTVVGVLNGAPTIVTTPVGAMTAGQSTTVSPVVVIVNEPGELLDGATVTITLGGDPSDELTFTPSNGVSGSYSNGVLTLTGSATAAAYQTVLQSVSLSTDAAGLVGVRTIEFAVTDAGGQESLLPGITALTVVGVLNGAPTIVVTPVGAVTAGQSTTVSPVVVIVSEPGENLTGATVTITLGGDPSDELTFTASNGVTGSYADGVLTLTGSATAAAYQTVLQSVSFSTDAAGLVGVRTIEFSVVDAAGQESLLPGVTALTVVGVLNGAPTIVTSPVGVVTAGQSTTVSPIVVIANEPGENLTGATVTITLGADPSDELTFTASNGVTGSYADGVLTLTGSATAAAYQTVLQSVSFSTDAAGLVGVRTIEFSVVDAAGQESLLPGVTALTVVGVLNGAPTIVTSPVGVVTAGQSTTVSPIVVIVNEPGELLDGATVTITLGGDPSDELTFTPSDGITGTYANGVLTLTGSASAAAYQTVLQSVSLSTDAAGLVGVRTIEFAVTDAGGQESLLPGITALTVVGGLNGAPTIVTTPVGAVTAGQSTTVSPVVVIVNEPGELLDGATVTITLGGDPSDELTFTGSGGITGTYADGVLTLTGSATAAAYQTVLQSVSLSTDAAGLVGVRTIEFAVTDAGGQESLLPGITALTVVGVLNGAPTIVVTPVGAVTAGQSTTVSPVVVIVSEPGENLTGATVTITLGGDPLDELTFTASNGVTGSYADGVLTLTGSATAAAYQTVLQSVSFSTDAAGLVGVRTIEFSVVDAAGQESLLPGVTALTVVGVLNGAPTIVTSPVGVVTAGQSTTVSPIVVIANEPGENLTGATVTITLGADPSDELTFTASNGVTGSYADGVLTLTGSATAAAYQTVLQSVSFSTDAAGLVGVRTIEFSVVDAAGQESLLPGVTALTVVGVLNGAPTIVTSPVGVVTAGQSTTVSPIVVIVNEPGELLDGATVTITLGGDPSDELTFTPSDGITGTYANGVLTLTGSASAAAYQTVLQSVSLSTDAAGLVGVRTIEFAVTDAGGQESLLPGITALTVVGG